MFEIKNTKTFFNKISLIICFVIAIGFINVSSINVEAESYNTQPTFNIQIDPLSPNPANKGEDITVSGKITPQPFEYTRQKKEIVLVLDVSGSMQGGKISNLKTAATNFITKMSSISNVEVGIVVFSSEATINPTLFHNGTYYATRKSKSIEQNSYHDIPDYQSSGTSFLSLDDSNNVTNLKTNISQFEALGGTNAGEGLRKAEYMLKNGDSTASKSIIFMSDGLPTFYSVQGSNKIGYTTIDATTPKYAGNGTDEDSTNVKNSTAYATSIGALIRKENPNINVFSIGYGLGSVNSPGNVNMQGIHKSMGGTTGDNGDFYATDTDAIDEVFNKIADKILEKYSISDVKIDLSKAVNFDSNFSTISEESIINLPTVNYKLQNRTDKKIVYEASEIPFSFTIRANTKGYYDNVFSGAQLTYPWNGITLDESLPNLKIAINDADLPIINANIVGQNPDPASRSENITLQCKIDPEKFKYNSTVYDESGPKDVIFLVDTSKSISDKLTSLKNGLFGKVVQETGITDAEYGIVTFNSKVKSDYISNGLTRDTNTLDSAIKSISCSNTDDTRSVGDAMEKAKEIFQKNGRANSAKYIVIIGSDNLEYTDDQLIDIEKYNYRFITVNLGYITPPTKVNNQVVAGADEPNNNIKTLHYNLIGKVDNGDNILEKEDNNYFLNINYSQVTNKDNPNEFFTKEENSNQMNTANEINNWILGLVASKIENGAVQVKTPSYTFNTKLKFLIKDKFNSISGFNTCSDNNYDVETPQFNVTYKLDDSGEYIPDKVNDVYFTIQIKDGIDIRDLEFGPGIVSYVNLGNELKTTDIGAYALDLKSALEVKKFGIYKGVYNKEPNITEDDQPFNLGGGTNVKLGATLSGTIYSSSDIKLEIPTDITVKDDIIVYTYDDNGVSTEIGKLTKTSSDSSNNIYNYSGQSVTEKDILIVYDEQLPKNSNSSNPYVNSLYTKDNNKNVKIKITNESTGLPELF